MKSFTIKAAAGGVAFAALYIWPVPHWMPGLRWWPVLVWMGACAVAGDIRDAIQNPDDYDDE